MADPKSLYGEDPLRINPAGSERSKLGVEVLAAGTDPCVAEYRGHANTVSLPLTSKM